MYSVSVRDAKQGNVTVRFSREDCLRFVDYVTVHEKDRAARS